MQGELSTTRKSLDVGVPNSNSEENMETTTKRPKRRRDSAKDRRKSRHSRKDHRNNRNNRSSVEKGERERKRTTSGRHRAHHDLGNKDRSHRGEKRKSNSAASSSSDDSDRRHKRRRRVKTHREKNPKTIKWNAAADGKKEIPKHLHPLGPILNYPPQVSLDPDTDYFKYHQHLRLFLYRRHRLYFEDLSSEDARTKFQSFVKEYNAGNLEQVYYEDEPLPAEVLDPCKRTKHEWKFNTTAKELESLNFVKEGVRKQTDYKVDASIVTTTANRQSVNDPRVQAEHTLGIGTGSMEEKNLSSNTDRQYKSFKTQDEVVADLRANRRLREHVLTAEEEFAVGEEKKKKYGRESNNKDNYTRKHSTMLRDQETATAELDDRDIYGDGDEVNFKAILAKEKLRKAKQKEDKAARISELESKEKQKQAEILKRLGLSNIQPGKKISIAPRLDIEK
jgi:hypothetical protein